ncbi:MAG: flagellar cap protein FliD N-terminal domain-containing protein [Thermodesulfobacteriota bacterium]|nr:flagellar cap protein FliD N-terminal domain-containing protein [Thermodesulfobacteriota bacterium]
MSGDITFSGLGSGTDLGSVVEKLVEIERAQSYRLEAWKSTWEAKIESIQGLNSRLLSLELFVNDFKSASQFLATTASSSSQTVLSVSSTSTAKPGSHSIIVGSSIPHMLASQGWADQNTMGIGDDGGDFVISVGDKGTITIDSGDFDAATTLQGLRDLINSDVENTGDVAVTASILDDGSDTNPYRLVITADNGGEDYEISITANPTDLTYAANWINPVVNSGGWSGTSQATSSGYYLGSDNKTYTFTAPTVTLDGANAATQVTWTKTGGGSGSIVIPDNYVAGTNIFVDGLVDG